MAVKISGNDILAQSLAKKPKAVLEGTKKAVLLYGGKLQRGAQSKAPVDTGTLKRSIGMTVSDGGMTATVRPTEHYASCVEYGTRFMDAQPYVKPAFNMVKPQFQRAMQRVLKAK